MQIASKTKRATGRLSFWLGLAGTAIAGVQTGFATVMLNADKFDPKTFLWMCIFNIFIGVAATVLSVVTQTVKAEEMSDEQLTTAVEKTQTKLDVAKGELKELTTVQDARSEGTS